MTALHPIWCIGIGAAWALMSVPLVGCRQPTQPTSTVVDTTDTRSKDLMQLTEEIPGLSNFYQALSAANFSERFQHTGPYTIFAPLDAGFRFAQAPGINVLTLHPDTVRAVVSRHVVRGLVSEIWTDSMIVATLADVPLRLSRRPDGTLRAEGQRILRTYPAQNGLVHVIPGLLGTAIPDPTDAEEDAPTGAPDGPPTASPDTSR